MRNQAYIYLTIVGVSSSARGKGFGSKLMDAIKQECDNEGLNLYLVNGVLIDTGPGRLSAIIVPFLENQKIEIVLLTHCHEDHSGNASYLAGRWIPVYINPSSLERCRDKTRL